MRASNSRSISWILYFKVSRRFFSSFFFCLELCHQVKRKLNITQEVYLLRQLYTGREKKNPHIREELTRPDKTGLIMFCFTEPNGELAKWFCKALERSRFDSRFYLDPPLNSVSSFTNDKNCKNCKNWENEYIKIIF